MILLKHIIILFLLSLLAVFFQHEIGWVLHGVSSMYRHCSSWINGMFLKPGPWLHLLVLALVLFVLPVIFATIVAGIWQLIKKKFKRVFVSTLWISWLVISTMVIIQGGV